MSRISPNQTVAVIGAGTMGAGIAQVAAAAGHEVLLFDNVDGAVESGIERTAKGLERQAERGKISDAAKDSLLGRIKKADSIRQLAKARLVIEAIVEDLDAKQGLFRELETICGEDAVLATNTSSISVTAIAAALDRPGRVVGMHFFNPAPVMKLVEVVSGIATEPAVASDIYELCKTWKKTPVHAKSTPGFIVNRVARPFYGEALRLLQEQVTSVATIDAVIRDCGGFRMGPFELMDLIGIDVNLDVTKSVYHAFHEDPRYRPSIIQEEMVAGGLHGRKTGRGFYDYGSDERESPAAERDFDPPAAITIAGDLGLASGIEVAIRSAGLKLDKTAGPGVLMIPGATLALTDGRPATSRSISDGLSDLVVFDLARDFAATPRLVMARSEQADDGARKAAAGLVQALGKEATFIEDVPGLILARTVAMLVNEAADAVMTGVCMPADLDTAMTLGVNYPQGPLAWGEEVGLGYILSTMDALAGTYCEDRYRASAMLRRLAAAGGRFHGES